MSVRSSNSGFEGVDGLLFLARVAHYFPCNSDDASVPSDESWLQCDSCFRWRSGVPLPPVNGLWQRWFCADAGRHCREPCDYCRVGECSCTPSQSYCGYSTSGYSLPEGYSVVVRFRHASNKEVGPPWLSYRSWCKACGKVSKGMDRRQYMEKWLLEHRGHQPSWESLTTDSFTFSVDKQVRDVYHLYSRLDGKGLMEGGLKRVVQFGSAGITEEERMSLKLLLEIVEASRFFDEAVVAGKKRVKSGSMMTQLKPEISDGKSSTNLTAPKKRRKRKPKQPDWMTRKDQWLIDGMKNNQEPESAMDIEQESSIRATEEFTSVATTDPPANVEMDHLIGDSDFQLTEKLLCGNLTKRKDKQSLLIDLTDLPEIVQFEGRSAETLASFRHPWLKRERKGALIHESSTVPMRSHISEPSEGGILEPPFARSASSLFSLQRRASQDVFPTSARRARDVNHRQNSLGDNSCVMRPASPFTLSFEESFFKD